jgi:uncharacterized protein (TIGR02246 family)
MRMLVLCAALLAASPASAGDTSALVAKFMQAWSAGDAKGLGSLFAPDADLITPDGVVVGGNANIEKFYAWVFANGYAGSVGRAEIMQTRELCPSLSIVDARWSIDGAHGKDGALRPVEKGIMAAVLEKQGDLWRIRALRENRGAAEFSAFATKQ